MRLYRKSTSHPDGEIRYGSTCRKGEVLAFLVQLYCWHDDRWRLVAQFDHNPAMKRGHDVTVEGLHMDVFRDGEKHETRKTFPRLDARAAFTFAEEYFLEYDQSLIEEYKQWHR